LVLEGCPKIVGQKFLERTPDKSVLNAARLCPCLFFAMWREYAPLAKIRRTTKSTAIGSTGGQKDKHYFDHAGGACARSP